MTATDLLLNLRCVGGFSVLLSDGKIKVRPASRLSSLDRDAIVQLKDDLLAILTEEDQMDRDDFIVESQVKKGQRLGQ